MKSTQNNYRPPQRRGRGRKRPLTLSEAIIAELKDIFGGIVRGVLSSVTGEDVVRGVICGALLIVFAAMQVTVFARFRLFGAVPDIMLAFTVAIGFSEGEKFGGVAGLVSAFVIESLGGVGMTLLPLLYVPCGFVCGVLAKDSLGDTPFSRALVMVAAAAGRAIVSLVYSLCSLDAPFARILTDIVVPEFFSTLLLALPVFCVVWVCYRTFHKTRAERTEKLK